MNKQELRQEIHRLVDQLKRKNDLKRFKELLEYDLQSKGDFWDELSEEQKADVDKGIAELDRGEGIPYEEIRKEIKDKYGF